MGRSPVEVDGLVGVREGPAGQQLVTGKRGAKKLDFALPLKFYRRSCRFPRTFVYRLGRATALNAISYKQRGHDQIGV